ncbi:MAG: hypothetical protein KKC53_05635 [Actinobacteria bacterium]|nr:hypothetical protein [Actinomycetota bacterium]
MKIKEFLITRYGPLRNRNPFKLVDFNLFWGKNEEGKTLTIDALIKLLLGRNIRNFEHIDRVEESPEGYIIIENDKGKEIKLPEKGNLTEVADLTPSESRNIFIIRNSDLSITRESEFYTNVTDQLTGLRTEDISQIKQTLEGIGKITPSGKFRDIGDEKLKSRIENTGTLVGEIKSLIEEIKEEEFDKVEKELVENRIKKEQLIEEIKKFEHAQKREKYEKGKEALKKLKKKDFPEVKELEKKERYLEVFREKLRKVNEEIRPKITNYQSNKEKIAGEKTKNNFFSSLAKISQIILTTSLLGSIITLLLSSLSSLSSLFSPPLLLLFIVLGVLSLISTIISYMFKWKFTRNKSQLAKEFEMIKFDISKFNLSGETIGDIISNIQKFEDECLNEDKKEKKMREELSGLIGTQQGILINLFGEKGKILEENIPYWDEEIKELEVYKDRAKNIKYDEKIVLKLKKEKESYEDKLSNLEDMMTNFQKDLGKIERKSNDILQSEEDYLYCKTSVDLKAVSEKLQKFINENESNRDSVLKVMGIFKEIEIEEKEKISKLFGKESPISKYFNEITNGLYEEVLFNQKISEIEVKRKDGAVLEAEKLSGGTYDQLYLSIRLSLGEKLLKGKKGFFIMDDPFIKADPDRLQRQIQTLKKISESGWQILYFSAKGEVKNALKKEIEDGSINYIEIKSIFI